MHRSPLHRHIPNLHDPALPTIECDLELTLNHDTVVDGHGAVHGRLDAWRKVDQADHGPIADVEARLESGAWLDLAGPGRLRVALVSREIFAYLVLTRVLDVDLVLQVYGIARRTVDDVGDAFATDHYSMVVAIVGCYEDSFAFRVVRGDEALAVAQVVGRELGDGANVCFAERVHGFFGSASDR